MKICFFKLISNNFCGDREPEPEDVVEQHLSIRADGRVWVSLYRFGEGTGLKKSGSRQVRIAQSQAEEILSLIGDHFDGDETDHFVDDAGRWEIELKSESGEKYRRRGSLISHIGDLAKISAVIRDSLDMPDLFCFDGVCKEDRIDSIRIDYQRVTMIPVGIKTDGTPREFVELDHTEHLYIDRKTGTVEHFQKVGQECDITHTYHLGDGIDCLLDEYDADSFLSEIEGNPDDAVDDPLDTATYRAEIMFRYSEPRCFSGSYDKKALPKDWHFFMNDVREYLRFYEMGQLMDPRIYGRVKRRSGNYMFVFVTFGESGQEYSYLCDDESVSEGDRVLVPVGKSGKETVATVTKIEYHPADEAPYPIDKIKSVIRAADEEE